MAYFSGATTDPGTMGVSDDGNCIRTARVAASRAITIQLEEARGRVGPAYVVNGPGGPSKLGRK